MNKLIKYTTVLFFVMLAHAGIAQDSYKVYSGLIYHFTKYVQWPSDKQSGDFVIGVVGNSAIISDLEALASSKTVNGRKIVVKKFSSASQLNGCHIVFLPSSQNGNLATAASKSKSMNALLVTESNGAAKNGAIVNFTEVGGKVRFELNNSRASAHNLKISSQLQNLAIIVG